METLHYLLNFSVTEGQWTITVDGITDMSEAIMVANTARGRLLHRAEADLRGSGYNFEAHGEREDGDLDLPIIGATLRTYTVTEGTVAVIDLY